MIGRDEELNTLKQMLQSNSAEFLAIYGRRRVGKTYLITSFFEQKEVVFFNVTGAKDGTMSEQINHFTKQIGNIFYKGAKLKTGKNWDETFETLTSAIDGSDKGMKVVLFFDEFPWMATKNSRLLQNLAYYWNQYWSRNKRIKLIICGSSASWIINKIIKNKGGLHNRLTRNIYLSPFNLSNTKKYLNNLGVKLTNKQVLQIYMAIGGIPYYLSKVEKGLSAAQNIDKLAFRKKSFFLEEFDNLFASLFDDYEIYVDIVRTIAKHRYGIGQEKLLKKMGKALHGKGGIEKLNALKDTNFITSFKPYGHSKKGIYYRVVDQYCLFYFDWIEPIKDALIEKGLSGKYWEKIQDTTAWYSWSGYAFEGICYEHISQISKALGLTSTALPYSWRKTSKKGSGEYGAQIDLLFDRDDDSITICEIKYTEQEFSIDKQYAEVLRRKINIFKETTKTTKQLFLSFISANGIKPSIYSEDMVTGVVTLDHLFSEVN